MEEGRGKGLKLTLAIYLMALAAKLTGYLLTGFMALLADALNSLTDIALACMMLFSFKVSRVPPDESHPFGHRRGENAAALIAGVAFITVVSFGILREAVSGVLDPSGVGRHPEIALGAMGFNIAINFAGIAFLRRDLQEEESPASKALLVDLVNDQLAASAAVVGISLSVIGFPVADPLASAVIALVIAYTAFRLVRSNVALLMGQSPGEDFYDEVGVVVLSVKGVKGVHDVLAEYVGPERIHVDLHIHVDPSMTVEEVDPLTAEVSERVKSEVPEVVHAMVHVCPHSGERRGTI